MLVFDASGSMAEMGYNGLDYPRIVEAQEAMHLALPTIAATRRLGLIVYGPGARDACSNVELRLRPVANAAPPILEIIDGLQPDGNTALTIAVEQAAETLVAGSGGGTIVLITDGKETCGGATCILAGEISALPVTIHVIGFKIRGDHFDWPNEFDRNDHTVARCLADSTGGQYWTTETTADLARALQDTLGCAFVSSLSRHPTGTG